jgi:hypothetical protein
MVMPIKYGTLPRPPKMNSEPNLLSTSPPPQLHRRDKQPAFKHAQSDLQRPPRVTTVAVKKVFNSPFPGPSSPRSAPHSVNQSPASSPSIRQRAINDLTEHRSKIVNEIVETERSYTRSLQTLIDVKKQKHFLFRFRTLSSLFFCVNCC